MRRSSKFYYIGSTEYTSQCVCATVVCSLGNITTMFKSFILKSFFHPFTGMKRLSFAKVTLWCILTAFILTFVKGIMVHCLKTTPLLPEPLGQPLSQRSRVFFVVEELRPDEVLIVHRTLYPVRQLRLQVRATCSFFFLHSRRLPPFCLLSPLSDGHFPPLVSSINGCKMSVQSQGEGRDNNFSPSNIWLVSAIL